ncbi:MAG: dehydrogenase [Aeromicrobium sp.]|nr:dehydrogenase [Aeromicrobium sp.]
MRRDTPKPLAPIADLVVVNTSDTTDERERDLYGDPLASIWGRCVAPYLGGPRVTRRVLRPVNGVSDSQRSAWLDEVEAMATETFGPGS